MSFTGTAGTDERLVLAGTCGGRTKSLFFLLLWSGAVSISKSLCCKAMIQDSAASSRSRNSSVPPARWSLQSPVTWTASYSPTTRICRSITPLFAASLNNTGDGTSNPTPGPPPCSLCRCLSSTYTRGSTPPAKVSQVWGRKARKTSRLQTETRDEKKTKLTLDVVA